MEREGGGDTSSNCCTWNYPQRFVRELEDLEIRGQVNTIQTTISLSSVRMLGVQETFGEKTLKTIE